MSPELAIDIERALDSAANDPGEALQLRRRAVGDAALRRGLRPYADAPDSQSPARAATALFILGRDAEVAAVAERCEERQVRFLSGLSELWRDRPLEAARILEACLQAEPRDERTRLALAPVLALLGRSEEAEDVLGALADETDRSAVLYALGAIAESKGDYGEARKHYESALANDPDHIDAIFRLAFLHDRTGEDEAAIALYERARRVKPTRVNVLINLGVLCEDREEYDRAAECYREILSQFPNHPRARRFLRDAEASTSMIVDEDMERKEDRRNQLLRTPISDFELSVRARNCLAKMNIKTLGDLITRTEAELLSYKNFGETSLQEIKDILVSKGLRLGMRRDEIEVQEAAAAAMPDVPGSPDPSILTTPVSELDFSVRSSKCMQVLGIQTVGDLCQHSENDLMRAPNFGTTSMQEVKRKLAELGLSLRKE